MLVHVVPEKDRGIYSIISTPLRYLVHVQVKEAVQEKLMSEEELEAKRREEAKKKRWGPFGIFPGGK